ncbi:MAG: hypothetical protein JJ850_17290 [Kordiimonadaceae bacterium]|nr:hypothetical protein [Kordiimonadaceae bacterium]MBO6570502.1 hypothetical protein [Kordiimonadaceae bacterium]MBO6966379.1 hypothetical protein [Kordiimonadaceae bacterium]
MAGPPKSKSDSLKVGIACVYFFRDEDAWILDLQLDFIERTTDVDFTVYAAAKRLQPELKEKLASRHFVTLVEMPEFDGIGGPEHGFFLSHLVRRAANDGCTHVCTLDCDSFPVSKGWPRALIQEMGTDYEVAAVFRAENMDKDLPHPCGAFFTRDIALLDGLQFWPDDHIQTTSEFKKYMRDTGQRFDTGIGLGFSLWHAKKTWLKLLRSNTHELHYIMAGVYDSIFFHLGASSRRPAFNLDFRTKPLLRLSVALQGVPVLWRLGRIIENSYLDKNEKLAKTMRHALREDPVKFIKGLDQNID